MSPLTKQIGKKIQDATGEKLSTFYLFQSISMAVQKGNAVCVMACVKDLQAWSAYSIFKYTKLKSYDKDIYIYVPILQP